MARAGVRGTGMLFEDIKDVSDQTRETLSLGQAMAAWSGRGLPVCEGDN